MRGRRNKGRNFPDSAAILGALLADANGLSTLDGSKPARTEGNKLVVQK